MTGKKRTPKPKPRRKPPKPQASSKRQHERFVKASKEAEADESETTFERIFRKIAPPILPGQKSRS